MISLHTQNIHSITTVYFQQEIHQFYWFKEKPLNVINKIWGMLDISQINSLQNHFTNKCLFLDVYTSTSIQFHVDVDFPIQNIFSPKTFQMAEETAGRKDIS